MRSHLADSVDVDNGYHSIRHDGVAAHTQGASTARNWRKIDAKAKGNEMTVDLCMGRCARIPRQVWGGHIVSVRQRPRGDGCSAQVTDEMLSTNSHSESDAEHSPKSTLSLSVISSRMSSESAVLKAILFSSSAMR